MSDYVGIVRNNERLRRAMRRLDLLFEETEELYKNDRVAAVMWTAQYDHHGLWL